MQAQPVPLTIVRVIEEPTTGTDVVDVLLGIVALTGYLVVGFITLGLLTGAVLVIITKLKARKPRETHASEDFYAALHGPTES